MSSIYHKVLKLFPKGYCLAFAYGSGVYSQGLNKCTKDVMIDFLFAVNDTKEWHMQNLKQNSYHYSNLKWGGSSLISHIQDNWAAKVYFNTLVSTDYGLIKYGVSSRHNLIIDLLDWNNLYIAGRLHKPVYMLHESGGDELKRALKVNLYAAVHTALLLLPESFTEEDLFKALAGLSYAGDFRMMVGEDQNKVDNIVYGHIELFRELYQPILKELKEYVIIDFEKNTGEQDISPASKLYHLSMLPKTLQLNIVREWNKDGRCRDLEDVLIAAANDVDSSDIVLKALQDIVRVSSLIQSAKGILTAGFTKSVKYSYRKIKKMVKSMSER